MIRSLTVLAADDRAPAVPDCALVVVLAAVVRGLIHRATNADQWRVGRDLRMRLKERFVAEGIRTPLPLLAGSASAAAGAR
jgi:hypothetical protein